MTTVIPQPQPSNPNQPAPPGQPAHLGLASDPAQQSVGRARVSATSPKRCRRPVCADVPWKRQWAFRLDPGRRGKTWRDRARFAAAEGVRAGVLNPTQQMVFLELLDRSGPNGRSVTVTKQRLGQAVHRRESAIADAITVLVEGGWLDLHHNQKRLSDGRIVQLANTYRPHIPAAIDTAITARYGPQPPKPAGAGRTTRNNPGQSVYGRGVAVEPVIPPPVRSLEGLIAPTADDLLTELGANPNATPAGRDRSLDIIRTNRTNNSRTGTRGTGDGRRRRSDE